MYAASVEGLTPAERATFNDALTRPPAPPRALSPAPAGRPALRAVPAAPDRRRSAERLAAIRALGGDVDLETGA